MYRGKSQKAVEFENLNFSMDPGNSGVQHLVIYCTYWISREILNLEDVYILS